jgi:hypothetical protein
VKGKKIKKTLFIIFFTLIFIFSNVIIAAEKGKEKGQKDKDKGSFKKGAYSVGIIFGGGGFGGSSTFLLGGSFSYFLTAWTAPGAKAQVLFGDAIATQKEIYLTLTQYLLHKNPFHLFLFGEFGYFHASETLGPNVIYGGLKLDDKVQNQGFITRFGPGLNFFLSKNVAFSVKGYYQIHLLDFTRSVPDLTDFGWGIGFFLVF